MKKLFILTSLLSSFVFAQIQKVEPMFWWKGMKNPELQILVYGKDINKYNIELSDQIQIKDITKTENPNYVFVTLNTNEINTSSFKINIKNKNKIVDSYTYELKNRQPNSANRSSFSSKDVVYLIMPDR
ncbi:MAG: cyclomaltodextrinase N-terminal domain-containing protein, partial [Weeksellaceae bacterium]|nr:cyclomaltodextrinase N-terminal domain-containing protein [Weeksellaceae bacterium]